MTSVRLFNSRARAAVVGLAFATGASSRARADDLAGPRPQAARPPDCSVADATATCDAESPPDAAAAGARPAGPNALAVAASIVPGILVHGSGHFAAGQPRTGYRLLALEGLGLGTMAAGFIPLVLTGASRRWVGTGAALTVLGFGMFAISMLSDIYGVLSPEGGTGAPWRVAPILQVGIGYRYVYDPVFSYRNFLVYDIDYRAGRWRVQPSAWFALDRSNSRLRALAAWRFVGPRPEGEPGPDGSYVDLEAALTRHAYVTDRFTTTTGELSVAGRLDMHWLGPSLRGSFAEMSVGWAVASYAYQVRGAANDVGELLLARFGYGVYLGWPGSPRGEVVVYYDHRHDGFAAGLKLGGLPSGVAGHFGVDARVYLGDHLGLAAEAQAGSAYVTGLSVLFRQGDPL